MNNEQMTSDRYAPPENTLLFFGQYREKMGIVKTISKRGLVYEYFADEDHGECFEGEVAVMASGRRVPMFTVECSMIYDSPAISGFQSMWRMTAMRQRGLQFKYLSDESEVILDRLLARCKPIHQCPTLAVND
jgi:hypothetical protein